MTRRITDLRPNPFNPRGQVSADDPAVRAVVLDPGWRYGGSWVGELHGKAATP